MGQLFFKKALQIAIREGRKRTTIRRWDRPLVRVEREAYAPGLGWLMIESVEPVELADLRDEDAIADGFASRAELIAALRDLYPDHKRDGKGWFLVRFRLHRVATARASKAVAAPPP